MIKKLLPLAIAVGLSACAGIQPAQRKVIACNQDPTFWTYRADGSRENEVRICFLSDGTLGYQVRPVVPQPTPEQVTAAKRAWKP